jgi:hypothetical protein
LVARWAPGLIWVVDHRAGGRDVMVDRSSRRGVLRPLGLCQDRHGGCRGSCGSWPEGSASLRVGRLEPEKMGRLFGGGRQRVGSEGVQEVVAAPGDLARDGE